MYQNCEFSVFGCYTIHMLCISTLSNGMECLVSAPSSRCRIHQPSTFCIHPAQGCFQFLYPWHPSSWSSPPEISCKWDSMGKQCWSDSSPIQQGSEHGLCVHIAALYWVRRYQTDTQSILDNSGEELSQCMYVSPVMLWHSTHHMLNSESNSPSHPRDRYHTRK